MKLKPVLFKGKKYYQFSPDSGKVLLLKDATYTQAALGRLFLEVNKDDIKEYQVSIDWCKLNRDRPILVKNKEDTEWQTAHFCFRAANGKLPVFYDSVNKRLCMEKEADSVRYFDECNFAMTPDDVRIGRG